MKRKNTWLPALVPVILLAFVASGCSKGPDKTGAPEAFVQSLKSQPVGRTGFSISLPPGYEITSTQGPDFEVYYFAPTDTTKPAEFTGGMYMGNAPSTFDPSNDSCQIQARTSLILDKQHSWIVFNCNEVYSIQVIAESGSGKSWNDYIHAFGGGTSFAEINKVFAIYATLRPQTSI